MRYPTILFVIFFGFLTQYGALGQSAKSTATVSAFIVAPITLTKIRDLNFGKISAGSTLGTVILKPDAASTRIASGGVTLSSGSGTVQSAKFIINGENGYAYSIILPTEITLSDGIHYMTADTFSSTPSGSGLLNGAQSIYVGATLNVNPYQEAGYYQSTEEFEIIVHYN